MLNHIHGYTRALSDPQDQSPVCYCVHCGAEIYRGNTCYPIDGWRVLCPECHAKTGETRNTFLYAGYDDETTIHIDYIKENQIDEE